MTAKKPASKQIELAIEPTLRSESLEEWQACISHRRTRMACDWCSFDLFILNFVLSRICSAWFGATNERIVAVKTIAGFHNSDEMTHSFFDRYFLGRFILF